MRTFRSSFVMSICTRLSYVRCSANANQESRSNCHRMPFCLIPAISRMSAPGRGSCTWRPSQVVAPGKQSGTRWWAARGTGPGVRGHRHGGSQVPDEEKEDDPPPQAAAPRCTSAQLTDHLEDYGAPPPSGKDRGVLGGCPGGSRRAQPWRTREPTPMAYPTRSKTIRDTASQVELDYNRNRLHSALGHRTTGRAA